MSQKKKNLPGDVFLNFAMWTGTDGMIRADDSSVHPKKKIVSFLSIAINF